MNEATWLPGVMVLGAGLLIGLSLALRMRKSGGKQTRPVAESPDVALQIRDLEARRDDLYRRIRAADEDKLGPDEIAALENAAAVTLRDLDLLTDQIPPAAPTKKARSQSTEEIEQEDPTSEVGRTRNPLLVGFAFGAAMVAVVALLVYFAVRDAKPSAPMGQPASQAGGSMEPPHEGQIEIPPEVAAQIAQLQNRLVTNPDDWQAHKQLALTYVATGQFVEAFSQASQILQQFPEDPDGLLVHGIVRLTMGQADQAVDLLDQVLAQYPDHRQALIYRGLALYQTGNVEQALDTWDMGLQMLGGGDPELEELIRMAQTGGSQPAGMTAAEPPGAAASAAPTSPPQAAAPMTQQLDPNGYPLTLELSPGAQVAPQATLFIFLRPAEGGPPVAARRISTPQFPMQMTLGQDDSMMGGELPESGTLVARLDSDGNVATAHAGDLAVEFLATRGQLTALILGN